MSETPPITRIADVTPDGASTTKYEGYRHGGDASFYISRNDPGTGPGLHTHPYAETFIIQDGNVRFTIGDHTIDARAGDVVVAPADTPHGFTCLGPGPMLSVNIHPVPRMAQVDLG